MSPKPWHEDCGRVEQCSKEVTCVFSCGLSPDLRFGKRDLCLPMTSARALDLCVFLKTNTTCIRPRALFHRQTSAGRKSVPGWRLRRSVGVPASASLPVVGRKSTGARKSYVASRVLVSASAPFLQAMLRTMRTRHAITTGRWGWSSSRGPSSPITKRIIFIRKGVHTTERTHSVSKTSTNVFAH